MSKKHALLSASGGKRWLTCPRSARLEAQLPDVSSDYADEGTLAHELSELLIAHALHRISDKDYKTELQVIKSRKYYCVSMHEYCDDFKAYVMERLAECRAKDHNTLIILETRLELTAYIPEGFGTADVVIISNGLLILIDLKYGQGVPVSCEDNEQLKIYGLGAAKKYEALFDIDLVELHIYQPRIDNISSWKISLRNLLKWGNEVLIPGAEMAFAGQGEFVPGKHCEFCRARRTCKALADYCLAVYKPKQIPGTITPKEVSEFLAKEDIVKGWLNTIADYALTEALEKGTKWPGFKLVEGISRRIIKDEEKAAEVLQKENLPKSEYMVTKLKGITDLENLVGKKRFVEIMSDLIHKPKGKPTLVPDTDKRVELDSAESAFKDIIFEDLDEDSPF